MSGIIPFQHYVKYFSDQAKSLPRLLSGLGYTAHAYHNFDRRFWLRDQVYPALRLRHLRQHGQHEAGKAGERLAQG